MRRRRLALSAAMLACVLPLGCGKPDDQDVLRMTVVPYENAQKLNEDYDDMAQYLARKAGRKRGKFIVVVDYTGVLPALQAGQVDVAYLSSFPYAEATKEMKVQPLAMPYELGSLTYRGIIFARADSPIRSVGDLRGRSFAFGDPASTSGYILPRALLEKAGVFQGLKSWRNVGDANMVVAAVENGSADAGSAYEAVFKVVYRDRPQKARGMRVLAHTDPIPNGVYVARPDMPAADVARLRQAFLGMAADPAGRAAMAKAHNDRMVPVDDRLFDGVRDIAARQGIDLRTFDKKH